MGVSSPDFFYSHVEKTDECWLWTGALAGNGYGYMKYQKKNMYAHRRSWEMHKGSIPAGLYVLHKCDNPACVNPDHLFLGSQSDNMKDCYLKGRLANQHGRIT